MKKIYSKIEPTKLLHIINRIEDISGRTDIIPPTEFLQLATMKLKKSEFFRPHKHIYRQVPDSAIAQEALIVLKGKVEVILYDLDDTIILKEVLSTGDISVTLGGGHTFTVLEDETICFECKPGPYYGQKFDKVFID